MKKILFQRLVCGIAVILILITGCNKILPTGDISGNIYFAGTTIPVSGVTVEVNGKTSTSSIEGSFIIDDIITGDYTLKAEKEGFDPYYIEVTISASSQTLDIPMTSQQYTSKVYGTIIGDYSKNPKPGLTVMVLNPDGSDSDLETTTSSDGYYQLSSIPQGERTIVVKESGEIIFESGILLADADYQFDILIPEPFEFTDSRDGNKYLAFNIGNQTWMAENLAFLPKVSPSDSGSYTGVRYYVYGYEGSNVSVAKATDNYVKYGVLYNWPAAMNGESSGGQVQGVCPDGWHLPADEEWTILTDYLTNNGYGYDGSGSDIGKSMASTSGWTSSSDAGDVGNNQSTNNSSGFNALPGGYRSNYNGFHDLGDYAFFWSSSEYGLPNAWSPALHYSDDHLYRNYYYRRGGFSVRCLKNN